jgi:hypothetical protein
MRWVGNSSTGVHLSMGENPPELDKKIKDIDAKIKALEDRLNSGQIDSEDSIQQLLELFYEVEALSPRSKFNGRMKLNIKATLVGGLIGWIVFFVAFVFLAPVELSLRADSISPTGLGPYQTVLNMIGYSSMRSIQLNQPFFVFVYYLIGSVCIFPDLFTVVFPVIGGLVAGIVAQYFHVRRPYGSMILGEKKSYYVRLDEGFVAGGILMAVLTLIVLVVSALMYGQWLSSQGLVVGESSLPWGYLFRVFLPTLFTYHVAAGGAAGAIGEVITCRMTSRRGIHQENAVR